MATGVQVVSDILGFFTIAEKRNVGTILRILGQFYYGATATGQHCYGRWGIHQVTDDALVALAVPDPRGDATAGWLANNNYYVRDSGAGGPLELNRVDLDLRGKRRLDGERQTLAFVIDSNPGSDGTLSYGFGFRILYSKR